MRLPFLRCLVLLLAVLACLPARLSAQRQREPLGRSVIALRGVDTGGDGTNNWSGAGVNQVYVGWRLLNEDPDTIAFNVYRSSNGGAAVKLNGSALTASTNFVDTTANLTVPNTYTVRAVIGGVEGADSEAWTLPANSTAQPCFTIPMTVFADGTYYVHLAWTGDLDGDGYLDIVADRIPQTTGTIKLEAYSTRTRSLLWRIEYGANAPGIISAGQNDGVTVADFDGDGRCEVVTKSMAGTTFGNGAVLPGSGTAVYLSVVDGATGAERSRLQIATALGVASDAKNLGAAWLDGVRPALVAMTEDHNFTAYNVSPTTLALTTRWTAARTFAYGHGFRIGDIDGDGRDEISDVGGAIDDNGATLFTNELNHGDRFHVADIDPDRPGLECFAVQQDNPTQLSYLLYDARTGEMLWRRYAPSMVDNGRGNVGSLDAAYTGQQVWSAAGGGMTDHLGNRFNTAQPDCNFSLWWDADNLREVLTQWKVDKWGTGRMLTGWRFEGATYSWRDAVPLHGDILGDWREEIITDDGAHTKLVIFSTTRVATTRTPTLLQDPQYRADLTLKGYMQTHHPGFYFGQNMPRPPRQPVWNGNLTWVGAAGANVWDKGTVRWKNSATGAATVFADGNSVLLDLTGLSTEPVTLMTALAPAQVVVHAPAGQAYTLNGAGSLTGTMSLTKGGAGSLTLSGAHTYTGATLVREGTLAVNGALGASAVRVDSRGLLAGSGSIAGAVSLSEVRAALAPGGVGTASTLQLNGGLTLANASVVHFDLASTPAGATDRVAITGNLSNSGATTVYLQINPTAGSLAPGSTYTLFTYTGTFSGNVKNFVLRGVDAWPCTLTNTGSAITLSIASTRTAGNVSWSGGTTGTWLLAASTGTGWTRSGTTDVFVTGDAARFDDTGAATPTVSIQTSVLPASTTVDAAANFSFTGAGGIGGTGGLTKAGTGTLTVSTTNTYTGPTVINGGVLAVSNLADGGYPSALGASGNASSNLVLNGGTLRLTDGSTSTFRGMTLGASGGTLDLATAASLLNVSGVIAGAGALTKSGPGLLLLNGVNTYTGGTVIQAGTVVLAASRVSNSATSAIEFGLGTGSVTLAGGTLSLADTSQGDLDFVASRAFWPIIVPAGASGRLDANGRMTLGGALTGSGTFTFYTPYVRTDVTGDWSAFAGRINVVTDGDGGDLRIANAAGLGNAWLNLSAGVWAYSRAGTGTTMIGIGALSGVAGSVLNAGTGSGLGANQPAHWRIGARNLDTTFGGVISGTSLVTKIGTGTLTLSGANTYTGATTVSAGRLVLAAGSLAGSAVTVQAGAGFGGQGAVTGNVTFNAGSTLVSSAAGPLAITGNVSFGGGVTVSPPAGITPTPGTYTLLTWTGTSTGTPVFSWFGPGLNATFNTSVAGQVTYTLTEAAFPPTNLVALAGNASASLSWTAASGAVSYSIGRSLVAGGPYTTIATGITGTAFTDTGLTNGTTYSYIVTTVNGAGLTASSVAASVSVGPVAAIVHLRLDETSGTVASDSSGNGRAASLTGGPAWSAGRLNNGLTLAAASTQYGSLPTGVAASLNDFTIATWVRLNTSAAWARIADFGSSTSNYLFLAPRSGSADLPRFAIRTTAVAEQIIDGSSPISAGVWTHVAVTLSGSTGTLYLNGVASGTNTAMTLKPSSLGSTARNYLGRSQFTADPYLSATLDEFQLYGRALTATEVAALAAPPAAPTGLVASAGDAQVSLTWSPVSGASGYGVKRATTAAGPFTTIATVSSGTAYTDTGLTNGTTYHYAVTTLVSVAESARSTTTSATPVQPLTPVQSWRLANFGSPAASGSGADDADPDGDGMPNLLEYAVDGPPNSPSANPLTAALVGTTLQCRFTRVADPMLTYAVDATTDFTTWTELWTSTGTANEAGAVTITDPTPITAGERRFLRLRVSVAP